MTMKNLLQEHHNITEPDERSIIRVSNTERIWCGNCLKLVRNYVHKSPMIYVKYYEYCVLY